MNFDIKKIFSNLSANAPSIQANNFGNSEDISIFEGINEEDSAGRTSSLQSERAGLVSALANAKDENEAREIQNRIDRIDDELFQQKLQEHFEKFVSDSTLPKDVSRQLFNLTVRAIEDTDLAQQSSINRSIEEIKNKFNLSESDLFHLEAAKETAKEHRLQNIEKEQQKTNAGYNKTLGALQGELEKETSATQRQEIQNQIIQLKETQFKDNLDKEKDKFLMTTSLPREVAENLFDLYVQRGTITNSEQLEKLNQQIELISDEYELNHSDMDSLSGAENLAKGYKLDKIEAHHDSVSDANLIRLEDLFKEIENNTDKDKISELYAKIDALGTEQFEITADYEKEKFLTTTDLPKDVAAQLFDLTMNATLSDDDNQIQMFNKELNTLTEKYPLNDADKKALDEALNLSKQYKLDVTMSDYVQAYRSNVEVFQQLNNDLQKATDSETREKIQNDIKAVTDKMRSETLGFEKEKFLLDTKLPRNVAKELFQLTIDKTQTKDDTQLNNINANIAAISRNYDVTEADLAHLADVEEVASAE